MLIIILTEPSMINILAEYNIVDKSINHVCMSLHLTV